jgi:hypothetical protein
VTAGRTVMTVPERWLAASLHRNAVGVEKAAALITSVFLHGTARRKDATADDRPLDGFLR